VANQNDAKMIMRTRREANEKQRVASTNAKSTFYNEHIL